MQSDWYRTRRPDTYLVVRSGLAVSAFSDDHRVSALLDSRHTEPLLRNGDSNTISGLFHVLGVDDCLKLRGFCLVKSSAPHADGAIWARLASESECQFLEPQ